ncbi:ThiF family adenylyltransferase [Microbispora sp. CSR-4]|uniref:HesA/MoeB/ThiF family protein n=1 Tax=Microbispora sp. CSR-4 TaxID=2592813 RepID=UPI0011CA237B|nr:ThiF family adenylyltransferase [Microbispora sp. CSR-4]
MRLPKVKAEHRPYRIGRDRIRIGGSIYGIAAEISDPHGHAWAALSAMDGTRAPADVADHLCRLFPGMKRVDAAGVVDLLLRSGYLEDAAAPPPSDLSAAETERYSRNKAFFRWVDLVPRAHGWEAQVALKRARVLVLGLGGTGSHAAWALAAAGVGRIHCVDRDVVEVSNLTRQALFTEADIGRPKADVVVERLTAINSGVRVTGETRAVESRADVSALLAGFDALALCADEPRGQDSIRIWANRACLMAGVPWAVGGYRGPLVSVGVFAAGGPCYECLTAAIEASLEPGVHVDLGGPGVLAPSAGISGHLTAQAVISMVTGIPATLRSHVTGINLIAPEQHVYTHYAASPECAGCAVRGKRERKSAVDA